MADKPKEKTQQEIEAEKVKKARQEKLSKYVYGALGARFLQEKNEPYAVGALDALAEKMGLSEDAQGFIEGAYSNEQGIITATNIYAKEYNNELKQGTGHNLVIWYSSVLNGLNEEHKTRITGSLTKHNDETLNSIIKKIKKSNDVLTDENSKEEEKTNAREVQTKYQNFIQVYQTLESYKLEEFRSSAINKAKKRTLENLI